MSKEKLSNSELLDDLLLQGTKSPLFSYLSSQVIALCQSLGIEDRQRILNNLEQLWLPTALDLATKRRKLNRTPIQGVLGGQGTGKSTLCLVLKSILNALDFSVATLSIDDLYLTYAERQALQQQDPRLIWRGPPGTHDLELGMRVIERCLHMDGTAKILLPRFDKSAFGGAGDRDVPEIITKPDILLFEGWFVGVRPVSENCFERPPAPITTPEDIQFAKDSNRRLRAYLPLWDKLDSLIVLYPEDYRLSQQWRKEAEQKMIATGRTGMSDEEIDRFVEYFWKSLHPELFIKPLIDTADLVVEIKGDRTLGKIYNKQESKSAKKSTF
ncbi:glycerate kinase [Pleurocapsales cyanobacterium LEGE 10410]|nr:glycerate kinase [Pleurocapsales cyanobacterium LEGE 10410]